jgi:hypothetical protein
VTRTPSDDDVSHDSKQPSQAPTWKEALEFWWQNFFCAKNFVEASVEVLGDT